MFRVWSKAAKAFINKDNYSITLDGKVQELRYSDLYNEFWTQVDDQDNYIIQRKIDIQDINQKEIYDGDYVIVYPENYEKTLIEDGGGFGPSIYFVDKSKPLPVKDIPLYKGLVYYNPPEYRVAVCENNRGIASVAIEGYWLEVIGNIFETPNLVDVR